MTRLLISTPPRLGNTSSILNLGVYPNPDVSSWSRSARWFGGFYDGVFTLYGDSIYDFFDTALGYDVAELDGNTRVWDGFIYEMVLHTQVDRIRSYDNVYNHVSAFAKNLLTNGGFETGDTTGWTENGTGDIDVVSSPVAKGLYAVEIVADTGSGRDTYITQTADIHAQTSYRLTFYYDDTDGPEVRYFIDSDIGTIIEVQNVEFSNSRYRRFTVDFVTQPLATTVTVGLACPATNSTTSYFDEIRLERLVDEKPQNVASPAKINQESINTYGLRQRIMGGRFEYMQQAENTTQQFLDANAFPKTARGSVSGTGVEDHSLDVYVRGYLDTLGWHYWALQTGGAILTLQSVFDRIVSENEFITGHVINGSPPNVALPDSYTETQFDILESCQNQVGADYRLHITNNGLLVCDDNDWAPRYYMREGELYSNASSALVGRDRTNVRTIQPSIVRDLDYPITGIEPESSYLDRRDFLMDSVEVDQDGINFST